MKTNPRQLTALKKYVFLESHGLWRESSSEQRKEVIVSFKKATLVLRDPKNERVLSHWSLPATRRLNPHEKPAIFSPDQHGSETLEISDPDLADALDTIRYSLKASKMGRNKLRYTTLIAGTALVVLLGSFVLPEALIKRAATALPKHTRQTISQIALKDMVRLTGSVCNNDSGLSALSTLAESIGLSDALTPKILVMRDGVRETAHLPDGTILINRNIIEKSDTPEVAAAFILVENLRIHGHDPILPALRYAGFWANLSLLVTGTLPQTALSGYGEILLQYSVEDPDPDQIFNTLKDHGIAFAMYVNALKKPSERLAALRDSAGNISLPERNPLIADALWVGLQNICTTS